MKPYYEQDGVTLYHGDNCDVMNALPKESIDLVVTSPPYDDLRTYGGHSWDFYGVAWQLKRLLKPGGVIVWVVADATKDGSETGTSMRQALHFKEIGLNLHDTMIYRKTNYVPLTHNRYEQEFEFVFVFSKGRPTAWNPITVKTSSFGGAKRFNYKCASTTELKASVRSGMDRVVEYKEFKQRGNVFEYAVGPTSDSAGKSHPAVFPDGLARDHILSWSNEGDLVLDPFSGSGTTAKMARELGRRCIGIEVNQEYLEISKARLSQRVLFGSESV